MSEKYTNHVVNEVDQIGSVVGDSSNLGCQVQAFIEGEKASLIIAYQGERMIVRKDGTQPGGISVENIGSQIYTIPFQQFFQDNMKDIQGLLEHMESFQCSLKGMNTVPDSMNLLVLKNILTDINTKKMELELVQQKINMNKMPGYVLRYEKRDQKAILYFCHNSKREWECFLNDSASDGITMKNIVSSPSQSSRYVQQFYDQNIEVLKEFLTMLQFMDLDYVNTPVFKNSNQAYYEQKKFVFRFSSDPVEPINVSLSSNYLGDSIKYKDWKNFSKAQLKILDRQIKAELDHKEEILASVFIPLSILSPMICTIYSEMQKQQFKCR